MVRKPASGPRRKAKMLEKQMSQVVQPQSARGVRLHRVASKRQRKPSRGSAEASSRQNFTGPAEEAWRQRSWLKLLLKFIRSHGPNRTMRTEGWTGLVPRVRPQKERGLLKPCTSRGDTKEARERRRSARTCPGRRKLLRANWDGCCVNDGKAAFATCLAQRAAACPVRGHANPENRP